MWENLQLSIESFISNKVSLHQHENFEMVYQYDSRVTMTLNPVARMMISNANSCPDLVWIHFSVKHSIGSVMRLTFGRLKV